MLKKILCAAAIMLTFTVQAEAKDEEDRYKIYMTQISERKGELTQLPVLLDTVSGRTWYMSSDLKWYPMRVLPSLPKAVELEGATYEPPK